MILSNRIKQKFVKEVLTREGKGMKEARDLIISKRRINLSANSQLWNTYTREVSGNDNFAGKLSIKHKVYQRFLDMKFRGKRKKKKFPIHNKIIWGFFNNIAYKLMYYYTEDTIARIKMDLEKDLKL